MPEWLLKVKDFPGETFFTNMEIRKKFLFLILPSKYGFAM